MSCIDVDHIIPQSLFDGNSSISNAENIKKTNKKLKSIDDPWLIQQFEKYSQLKSKKFVEFSDVNSWEKLKEERRGFFEEQFIAAKMKIIS